MSGDEIANAISAIRYGVIDGGFDGPDGVTKDQALEYAAMLCDAYEESERQLKAALAVLIDRGLVDP